MNYKKYEMEIKADIDKTKKILNFMESYNASSKIQSVLFRSTSFTKSKAIGWLKKHGFKHGKYDGPGEYGKYHRFRQFNPNSTKKHRISKHPIQLGIFFIYEF
jgi:hypothetical protein